MVQSMVVWYLKGKTRKYLNVLKVRAMNSTVCISPQNSLIFQLPHSRRKIICFNCLKYHSIRNCKPTISFKPTIVIPENMRNYYIWRTIRKIKTTRSEIIIFRNLRAVILKSEINDIRNQV